MFESLMNNYMISFFFSPCLNDGVVSFFMDRNVKNYTILISDYYFFILIKKIYIYIYIYIS